MSIIRTEKTDNYTTLCNQCLRNKNISARAKGIFAYLMTLPDDWKIYKTELHKHFKEGRDALNTAFTELEEAGYVSKVRSREGSGLFDGWEYTIYESTDLLENRNTVNPSDGESVTTKYLSKPNTNKTNCRSAPAEECGESELKLRNPQPSSTVEKKEDTGAAILAHYNEVRGQMPKCIKITAPRQRQINARIADVGLDELKRIIRSCADMPHLQGQNDRGWTADLEWITADKNFIKICEGKYEVKKPQQSQARPISVDVLPPMV